MNCLVTGGAGFIGSHLAEALCRCGGRVIVLDDLSAGSLTNLAWRQAGDALEFVQGDAGDEALLRRLLPGVEWVFHEAAIASVARSVDDPVWTNRQNLEATLRLLTVARDTGVRRVMFASSSAIYGDDPEQPKRENLPPQPLSPYALQKYASERYAQLFHRLYGLETVSLRYFNIFGPRQSFDSPYSGVIAKFCTTLLAGHTPVIFGDGFQTRDFTPVENVVHANLLAAEAPATHAAGAVFNVAGGTSVSLLDLLQELNHLTGQKLTPRFEPARPGDVRHSQADLTAITQALNYQPVLRWQEGLRRTLDSYREAGPQDDRTTGQADRGNTVRPNHGPVSSRPVVP